MSVTRDRAHSKGFAVERFLVLWLRRDGRYSLTLEHVPPELAKRLGRRWRPLAQPGSYRAIVAADQLCVTLGLLGAALEAS